MQDEAEALPFVQPLARAPHHWLARGLTRRDQGDLAGAIAAYDTAIQLDPTDATTYTNRGLARRDQGDLAGAIADYDTAIQLDPTYTAPYNNRGNVRRQQGDLADAIADYDTVIQIDPADARAYNNRGLALRMQGNSSKAIRDLEKARELSPDDLSILVNLAGTYIDAGETQQGRKLAEEALSLLPESDLYNRACVQVMLGNQAAALDLLKKHLKEDPSLQEWARQDPDWRSLHSHPRFRALVGLPPLE
jgi:tetratricopeptide (TPR) repeat protein